MSGADSLRETYIEQIHEQGFVSAPDSVVETDIVLVFASFQLLLDEVYDRPTPYSKNILDAFKNEVPGRPHDSRGFIEQRRVGVISSNETGRDPATEDKDQLHFTPQTVRSVEAHLAHHGGVPKMVRTLLNQCTDVYEAMRKSSVPVFEALGIDDYLLAPEGFEDVHILRLLHHLGRHSDKPTASTDLKAELHFDRSKFTAAKWDSRPGLKGAPGTNGFRNASLTVEDLDRFATEATAHPITHRPGYTEFFPGAGYKRLPAALRRRSGDLPIFLHYVEDLLPDKPRDAFVFFANEHSGITTCSAPRATETGFGSVRKLVEARQQKLARRLLVAA
jgi:hypothetical protein